MWRHVPWLAALGSAPLLFGSVTAEGQAVVGLLLGLSVLLLAGELGRGQESLTPRWWRWAAVGLLVVLALPLPALVVQWLSPAHGQLAQNFPLESGAVSAWLTLTGSPAGTAQRYWELAQAVVLFWLARQGAHRRELPLWVARVLVASLFLLVLSEGWLRWVDDSRLLGIWENRYLYAAGTFANRNHFANWIYVAVLFLLGWGLRTLWPLHGACARGRVQLKRRWPTLLLLGMALFPALAAAVACGSRAGLLAFAAGLGIWLVLLLRRSRNRARLLVFGGVSLGFLLVMLAASSLVLDRLEGGARDFSFKWNIWQDSLAMTRQFPWFGVGPGAFAPMFNHFKTMEGEKTFWHAENDLVQWVAETGVAGTVVVLGLVLLVLGKVVRGALRRKVAEPELLLGAVAALAAFGVHAQFEFVGQTQANLLLAAALLGLAAGLLEEPARPELPPPLPAWRVVLHYAGGTALVLLAAAQAWSFYHWQASRAASTPEARAAALERSLRLWPWASERRIAWLRAQVLHLQAEPRAEQLRQAADIRRLYLQGLRLDPYHWEMRLELAWLDLAFGANPQPAREQAWLVMRLNPLQPRLGLRFARHFAAREPPVALEFLRAANAVEGDLLKEALEIAWLADRQPSTLWTLTPDTPPGLLMLADFALARGLAPLARQACLQLTNRVSGLALAERLLRAGDAALATNVLGHEAGTPGGQFFLIRALLAERQFPEAYRLAERLCRARLPAGALDRPLAALEKAPPLDELRALAARTPADTNVLRQLAERIVALPPPQRDLPLLRQLATQLPGAPRLVFLTAQTEWDLGLVEPAARRLAALAGHLVRDR